MRVDHNYEQLIWSEERKSKVFRSVLVNKPVNLGTPIEWKLNPWIFCNIPHHEELVLASSGQKYYVECHSNPLPSEHEKFENDGIDIIKNKISIKGWVKHIDKDTFTLYSVIVSTGSKKKENKPLLITWNSPLSDDDEEQVHIADSSFGVQRNPIAHYKAGKLYCAVCPNTLVKILPSLRDVLLPEISCDDFKKLKYNETIGFLLDHELITDTASDKAYQDFFAHTCTTKEMKRGLKQVVDKRLEYIKKFVDSPAKDQRKRFSYMIDEYRKNKKYQTMSQHLVAPTSDFERSLEKDYIGIKKIFIPRNKECLSFFLFFFSHVFAKDHTTKDDLMVPHPKHNRHP